MASFIRSKKDANRISRQHANREGFQRSYSEGGGISGQVANSATDQVALLSDLTKVDVTNRTGKQSQTKSNKVVTH